MSVLAAPIDGAHPISTCFSSSSLSNYQQGELLSRMFQDVGQLQKRLGARRNGGTLAESCVYQVVHGHQNTEFAVLCKQ